jgi:hypothetical protein
MVFGGGPCKHASEQSPENFTAKLLQQPGLNFDGIQ